MFRLNSLLFNLNRHLNAFKRMFKLNSLIFNLNMRFHFFAGYLIKTAVLIMIKSEKIILIKKGQKSYKFNFFNFYISMLPVNLKFRRFNVVHRLQSTWRPIKFHVDILLKYPQGFHMDYKIISTSYLPQFL